MNRMKTLVGLAAFGAALMIAAPARADTYTFFRITNNNVENLASQLSVDVTAGLGGTVDFTFYNIVGTASSITDIYFDDGTLLSISSIADSGSGVDFAAPASPGQLPGGESYSFDPPTATFSADSAAPASANGVNSASEWVRINFTLQGGQTFADTIAAMTDGSLRLGLHVQAIGVDGGSDSYINNPPVIPLPGAALLGAMGLGLVGWRRKKAAA